MKRLDEDKVSWVEFLRSIKFTPRSSAKSTADGRSSFAGLNPSTRLSTQQNSEDASLIRSGN